MLGNAFLLLSVLFLLGLLNVTSARMPSGDAGVGYSFLLAFCGLGFFAMTGFLTWHLGATARFDWLPALGGFRNWLIFFAWLAFAVATFFGSAFKIEWHEGEFPPFLRWLAQSQISFWLPALMLGSIFWLLNFSKMDLPTPPAFVQNSLKTGFAVSLLMCGGGMLFGFFRAKILLERGRQLESAATRGFGNSFIKKIRRIARSLRNEL